MRSFGYYFGVGLYPVSFSLDLPVVDLLAHQLT
jgi:hypothetical protein